MHAGFRRMIEKLYMEMYVMMTEYACSVLQNPSLAEEAVQETFRVACQKAGELCTSDNPRGWLLNALKFVIANTKQNMTDSRRLVDEYASERISELAAAEDRLRVEILYEDIAKSEEFVLLKEMAIDGKTHFELARSRGISVVACRKRVQRAKETLRKKIKGHL